jgi:phage terminase large subunit-like protein
VATVTTRPRARAKTRGRRTTSGPAGQATAYASDVIAGRIVAGPYVRLACKRHIEDIAHQAKRHLEWKPEEAERVISFFAKCLTLEGGKPFLLEPFQAFIVGSIFGWFNADGTRRFKNAYVEQGKGNGKTPTAAGIGVYGLIADGEPSPEVYSAATTHDQASICWKDAKRMVEHSDELKALVGVLAGSLICDSNNGVFRAVSSEHRGLDGKRVFIALIDELHEHPTSIVVDKMRAGLKARKNGFVFEITNSGDDLESVCYHHHEYSVKVLEGVVEDPAWFAYVCALDEGDDWRDEACWPKVNPGLDVVLPRSYLREQVREAMGMPSKEGIVKRLNFCIWTQQHTVWIPMEAYDACPIVQPEEPGWAAVAAGLDLSSKLDLTAFVVALRYRDARPATVLEIAEGQGDPEAEKKLRRLSIDFRVHAVPFFWLPEATLAEAVKRDRVPYDVWRDHGWLRVTPGNVVGYDLILEQIVEEIAPRFGLKAGEIGFDPYNATQLAGQLAAAGLRTVMVDQTVRNISEPAKLLEALVVDRRFSTDGNPVLKWCASNVAVREDKKGNIFPFKPSKRKRIDGIVATIIGLSRLIVIPETKPMPRISVFGGAPQDMENGGW